MASTWELITYGRISNGHVCPPIAVPHLLAIADRGCRSATCILVSTIATLLGDQHASVQVSIIPTIKHVQEAMSVLKVSSLYNDVSVQCEEP